MSDPVILSSGHTFDRVSIQRWFDSGHRSCPITKLPLPDPPSLIPNHALRSLILNYAPLTESTQPDSLSQLGCLVGTLTMKGGCSHGMKLDSLCRLTEFLRSNSELRGRLSESGAVSAVLRCVDEGDEGVAGRVQEKALGLLLNLSLESDDTKVGLVAEGAVTKLVTALGSTGAGTAATVFTSLAMVEVNKATIGAHPGAILALVHLLRIGRERERKEAATALFVLCSFPENRRRTVDCGGVPILVRIAKGGLERAVQVMGLLAKCKQGREEMVRCEGMVQILVNYVKNGTPKGVQFGLMALNLLSCCSEKVKKQVKNEGVLEICIGIIQLDNDQDKIHRIASNLAEVLKEN